MRITVTSDPEDCLRQEEFVFTVAPDFTVSFVRYNVYQREAVDSAFVPGVELWQYPDLTNRSTIDQPTVPEWVLADARQLILLNLKFDI